MENNIKRFKHVSNANGQITYLEVNSDLGTYSEDYYLVNGGHFGSSTQMTTKKEIARLKKYYQEVLNYKKA